jgi:hypothetical protein
MRSNRHWVFNFGPRRISTTCVEYYPAKRGLDDLSLFPANFPGLYPIVTLPVDKAVVLSASG